MVLLMGLFTLVLLDKRDSALPQLATGRTTSHLSSDFMSGFLATLLATPVQPLWWARRSALPYLERLLNSASL